MESPWETKKKLNISTVILQSPVSVQRVFMNL